MATVQSPEARQQLPVRACLAITDIFGTAHELLEPLAEAGILATFFAPAEDLVRHALAWTAGLAHGHQLGNGALLGATDEGRIRNWSCRALEEEFKDVDRLLRAWGMSRLESAYLPGNIHVCAEGRYRAKVQRGFDVCLSGGAGSTYRHGVAPLAIARSVSECGVGTQVLILENLPGLLGLGLGDILRVASGGPLSELA